MLEKIWDFFFIDTHRFSKKLLLFFSGIILLFFVDYFFRFSDSYIAAGKIEQIEKIESLLEKDSLRQEAKKELIRIENGVIRRQGFWDLVSSFASLIKTKINSPNTKAVKNNNTKPINPNVKKSETVNNEITRDLFTHVASSSWWLFMLGIALPFIIYSTDKKIDGYFFGVITVVWVILVIAGGVFSYVFSLIPILFNAPIINYLLNFLLSFMILFIIGYINNKREKKAALLGKK